MYYIEIQYFTQPKHPPQYKQQQLRKIQNPHQPNHRADNAGWPFK
jgi:hypothetical protein